MTAERQRRPRRGTARAVAVGVQRAVRAAAAPGDGSIRRWARAALGARGAGRELGVRIVGAAEGRRLNADWRGKDYATNVLSFPAPRTGRVAAPLGDLVICAPVVAREAREQRKPLVAHWAHLVVHGSLHLIGYDHERDADALRMERRERRVLAALGFPDPYAEVAP
ncbi:MAG: rRNA maturation RNase YbeY [Steroidobacteraceae bacterium]